MPQYQPSGKIVSHQFLTETEALRKAANEPARIIEFETEGSLSPC